MFIIWIDLVLRKSSFALSEHHQKLNRLGGVIVNVVASRQKVMGSIHAQVKPKTLKLVFSASPLSMQHLRVRAKTGRPIVRIMCLGKLSLLSNTMGATSGAGVCYHSRAPELTLVFIGFVLL